jgi:glutamate dehydrogenase/leucine dehydrogenase
MKKECPPDDYLKNGLYSILACGTRGVSLLSGTGKETNATWRLRRGNHQSERNHMKPLRLALLGFGTVGQWLAQALQTQHAWLQQEYGLLVTFISVATARSGLIYRGDGLDIPTLLHLAATRQSLSAHPEVIYWTNILE